MQLLGYQDKLHWNQDNQGLKVRTRQPICLILASPSKSHWPDRRAKVLNANELDASVLLLHGSAPLSSARAQGVDNSMLLHPPADSWPLYHGTYNGQRHSKLEQITPQNVGTWRLHGLFRRNSPQRSSPSRCWSTVCCTLPCQTKSGPSMRSRVSNYGSYTYPPNHWLAYWQPRRGDVQGLALFSGPGWASGIAQRQGWQRAMDCAGSGR